MIVQSVQIVGDRHWASVLAGLLDLQGIPSGFADELVGATGLRGKARILRWALGPAPVSADLIHYVFVPTSLRLPRLCRWRGRPLVFHWIGTDVVNIRAMPSDRRARWVKTARSLASLHVADSPELADEVRDLGFPKPHVVRLLPATLQPAPARMPEPFAVLSYWADGKVEFYGGHWVLQLAREFSDIPFYIAGRCTRPADAPDNVTYLGWIKDVSTYYDRCSVLIRLPRHDSISVMVLEMLARARHAIYSRPFPHCHHAEDLETARDALARIIAAREPNHSGPAFVAREFNPHHAAAALVEAYRQLPI